MLLFKRNMLTLGDFEYILSDTEGSFSKIIRHREGKEFRYTSQGCPNDFQLKVNRKYVATASLDGDDCRIGGYYNTSLGIQGSIMYCIKKGSSFLKNIFYWSTLYDNRYYKIYEVGRKAEGTFYCVYLENVLVAMIRKDPEVISKSTQYEIYSERFVPKEMLSVFTLFLDLTRYYPNPSDPARSTQYRTTFQKELKEKYDHNFIPRIKAMEGIATN